MSRLPVTGASPNVEERPGAADDARVEAGLAAAVSRLLGTPVHRLVEVVAEPLDYDAFLANRTVTRVHGTADTMGGLRQWSLIEKVTEGPDVASPYLYDNGDREFRAYESGLLDDLAPGVRASTAQGLHRSADGRLTLWLEDLAIDARPLAPEDLLAAAARLGRLAGRWLGRLPDAPWLFTGWIDRHGQPEAVAPALERMRTLRKRHTIERRLGLGLHAVVALVEDQPRLAEALRGSPRTLCHHDAVGANVFVRGAGGDQEIVLIDWEMVGPGPAGADLVSLLFSSARRGDISARDAVTALDDALDAYATGMREAGADVRRDDVAAAVDAAIALRWVLARDIIVALEEGSEVRRGSAPNEPPGDAMEQFLELSGLLFAAAERTRSRLAEGLG